MINKFLKKIAVFLIVITVLLTGVFFYVRNSSNFQLEGEKQMLIIGHSHSECAYNDSLIDNCYNLSSSGSSFFYDYFKLKKIIEQNPQIKTVFLEIAYNQFSLDTDKTIWGDYYLNGHFKQIAPFIDKDAFKLIYSKNPKGVKSNLTPVFRNLIRNINKSNYIYSNSWGEYKALLHVLKDTLDTEKINYDENFEEINFESYQFIYLRKSIDLLTNNNVSVFFITTPTHPKWEGNKYKSNYSIVYDSLFNDVELLDFSAFQLATDDFADYNHLNVKGAEKISSWFNSLINGGLLSEQNKQILINKVIKDTPN